MSESELQGPSGNEVRITAVVLTLNEEANIKRCLASLTWTDEIVVVDSGSRDRTVEMATSAGARVVKHQQAGVFRISDQRNWALDDAGLQGDWVLFIDADEETTDVLAREVRARCGADGGPDAYRLAPKFMFWGRWMRRSMRYPSWHDRLVRMGKVHYAGGVWEHFEAGTSVGTINEPYVHYGNSQGFSHWLERHNRYSTWDAESVFSYLESRNWESFGTSLRLFDRKVAARFWRLRPILRFVLMYVIRGGFLDGPEAFVLCVRYAIFDYMTAERVAELRRRKAGRPL